MPETATSTCLPGAKSRIGIGPASRHHAYASWHTVTVALVLVGPGYVGGTAVRKVIHRAGSQITLIETDRLGPFAQALVWPDYHDRLACYLGLSELSVYPLLSGAIACRKSAKMAFWSKFSPGPPPSKTCKKNAFPELPRES